MSSEMLSTLSTFLVAADLEPGIDAPDGKKFTIPPETVSDGTENGANGAVFTVCSAV